MIVINRVAVEKSTVEIRKFSFEIVNFIMWVRPHDFYQKFSPLNNNAAKLLVFIIIRRRRGSKNIMPHNITIPRISARLHSNNVKKKGFLL